MPFSSSPWPTALSTAAVSELLQLLAGYASILRSFQPHLSDVQLPFHRQEFNSGLSEACEAVKRFSDKSTSSCPYAFVLRFSIAKPQLVVLS